MICLKGYVIRVIEMRNKEEFENLKTNGLIDFSKYMREDGNTIADVLREVDW